MRVLQKSFISLYRPTAGGIGKVVEIDDAVRLSHDRHAHLGPGEGRSLRSLGRRLCGPNGDGGRAECEDEQPYPYAAANDHQ